MDKKEEKEKRNVKLFLLIFGILILILYFKNKKGSKLNNISFREALKKSKIKKIASKYT